MMRRCTPLLVLVLPSLASAQAPPPIIDMHLHALTAAAQGPPPLALCLPITAYPAASSGSAWGQEFFAEYKAPPCAEPVWSAETDEALLRETLEVMERRNVIGVVSGPLRDAWDEAAPDRMIRGTSFFFDGGPMRPPIPVLRSFFENGRIEVFAEVTSQYLGIEPADSVLAPYFALAEEMDVPVGIHVGPGPPGAPYLNRPEYRARLHSPLLVEEVLLRHPDLRLYLMHAGWPMIDDLIALMWAHPQVYVGVGVISWGIPRAEFHGYLRRIVEAGFGDRVMFGSDQMVWPGALETAIESIESAGFLNEAQKRDILYNNAARFLRLTEPEIDAHHRAGSPPRPGAAAGR